MTTDQKKRTAVIIGAGPAGLTAALEMLRRTDIRPFVLEVTDMVGGISRTVRYNGNRMDIGGHRFFSKSDRVMSWWLEVMPLEAGHEKVEITYQRSSRPLDAGRGGRDPDVDDLVMLLRPRKSRIRFQRKFFDYPISLSPETLRKLGLLASIRIGFSYLRAMMFPIRPETNLEEFFINRFGRRLYETFFKSYTEKVWGVACTDISAEWGAQRIKGLSIARAITHFVRSLFRKRVDVSQKGTETSLIEQFLYPKYGPGQMWEEVRDRVRSKGGDVLLRMRAEKIEFENDRAVRVVATNQETGETRSFDCDFVISTMPVRHLLRAMETEVPSDVREISEGLQYRDFVTVGLLLESLAVGEKNGGPIRDNWIYIQEPDVLVGRLQIFNNWSPYMVADPTKTWVGLEYFCNQSDDLWNLPDREMIELAADELCRIGLARREDVLDGTVVRVPKTYPAYFGTYEKFDLIREFVDQFPNLFLIGRNGMHKYNNQDHSMLAAMVAVDNILEGRTDKSNLWKINTEEEYHEEKVEESAEPG